VILEIQKLLGIQEGETTPDRAYSLETVACIGACGLAPNMIVSEQNHGHLTAKKVSKVLGQAGAAEPARSAGVPGAAEEEADE
jgi:NADH:ubiquinone oxidoreductase subunit E